MAELAATVRYDIFYLTWLVDDLVMDLMLHNALRADLRASLRQPIKLPPWNEGCWRIWKFLTHEGQRISPLLRHCKNTIQLVKSFDTLIEVALLKIIASLAQFTWSQLELEGLFRESLQLPTKKKMNKRTICMFGVVWRRATRKEGNKHATCTNCITQKRSCEEKSLMLCNLHNAKEVMWNRRSNEHPRRLH
jgi:hypothetical protein